MVLLSRRNTSYHITAESDSLLTLHTMSEAEWGGEDGMGWGLGDEVGGGGVAGTGRKGKGKKEK